MRVSILLWSMASGAILGLFIDATLIGLVMLASAALPALSDRLHSRWLTMPAAVSLRRFRSRSPCLDSLKV